MSKLNAPKGVAPGAELLNTSFSELASSRESWRAADKAHREAHREAHGEASRSPQEAKNYRSAKSANLTPEQRISRYLERLEAVLSLSPERRQSEAPHIRLQQRLINEAVIDITNEALVGKIAHGLFLSEKRAALERGHGGQTQKVEFESVRGDYTKLVYEKHTLQHSSLSQWTSYLHTNDGQYPAWFRYLAVRGVVKMGEFDRDIPKFARRSQNTLAPFPELNSEALGLVYKVLSNPADPAVLGLINQSDSLTEPFRRAKSFSALYAVALVATNQTIDRSRLEGEWRKYDKGSAHSTLEQDLSGKGTGWCTATGSARQHLDGGDFYVFYTKDKEEQCTVPRVAIRMENDAIAEIRGIAPRQELEPEFIDIVEEKGKTLLGYEKFQKASADMKLLTELDKRCFVRDAEGKIQDTLAPEPPLSKEELRFLYQVDSKIESFGYGGDPRIAQLLQSRTDMQGDYAAMYGLDREQVAVSKEDISSTTRVYLGGLGPEDYQILNQRKEPLVIVGKVDFTDCTSLTTIPEGVEFQGHASFNGCTSLTTIPEGVVFQGIAHFCNCTSLTTIPEGVVFQVNAYFDYCTSLTTIPEGVVFQGYASFEGCTSLTTIQERVVFQGDANFAGCTSLTTIQEGVEFQGNADFNDCTALTTISKGVVFQGDANFAGCTSLTTIPEGVEFQGNADCNGCTSLTTIHKGVVFRGYADFNNCISLTTISEGVVFQWVADFNGCTSLHTIGKGTKFYRAASFRNCPALISNPTEFMVHASTESTDDV